MQKQQVRRNDREQEEEVVPDTSESIQKGEKLKSDIDELLEEIDDVLEQNAEYMVKNYVQGNGE